jgi:uncharacterized protein (TIGR03083 family)
VHPAAYGRLARVTGDDVRAAVEVCVAALTPRLDDDWSAPVPGLDFTVSSVLAHASLSSLWYALDMWAGETDSAGFMLAVADDAVPSALIAGLRQAGSACAASLDAAPADLRGYHPAGAPDPSGFAAMACAELLVHTDDALRGLGTRLDPPRPLAAAVLARLFPGHEADADPWQTLLWAHARPTDINRPMDGPWHWHPAPLH